MGVLWRVQDVYFNTNRLRGGAHLGFWSCEKGVIISLAKVDLGIFDPKKTPPYFFP